MAYTLFYSVNQGIVPTGLNGVTVATSSQAADMQLEIDVTNPVTREGVILALRQIEQFILSNGVGTATGPGVDLPKPVYP